MGLYRSKTITAAKHTADRWFNLYIRLRDADVEGNVECITCGEIVNINDGNVNASHFVEADCLATRYEEWNVHASCVPCNGSANGKQYQHGKAIAILHGPEVPEELLQKAEGDKSYSKEELMEIAREYKQLAEELAELKGIEL